MDGFRPAVVIPLLVFVCQENSRADSLGELTIENQFIPIRWLYESVDKTTQVIGLTSVKSKFEVVMVLPFKKRRPIE